MNKYNAIGYLEDLLTTCDCIRFHFGKYDEAIETAISALEKQIPKKPIIKPWSPARCPSCGNELSTHHGDGYYAHRTFMDYCDNKDCLQRLDWRNEDE